MNKKISIICICFLFISISVNATNLNYKKSNKEIVMGYSYIEEINGVKILHVNGSFYEMGYQQGSLLKEDINRSYNCWFNSVKKSGVTKKDLLDIWNQSKDYIPECYKQEIQGIADGANIAYEEVAAIAVVGIGIYTSNKCSFFSLWGNATKDGKLYHVHSSDWSLNLKDPYTDTYECNRQLVIVRKPDIGYDSVSISLPGCINVEQGINERKIVISYTNVLTDDYSKKGVPMGLRQRMVLDNADTYLDAIDIMNQNKVCGKNFLISDGKIPLSIVIEQDANDSCISTWDDDLEDIYPSKKINNVLRRSNFFLNYSISGLDDNCYKKSTFLRFILNIFGFNIKYRYYYTMLHFKVLSKEVEKNWGNFDLNLSIGVLRNVYSGKTKLFYGLIQKFFHGYTNSWYQIACCPETGDMILSFAKDGNTAFKQELNRLNYNDLTNSYI